MKVLQINTRYYNGGSTGRITFDLKKVMEANGIESYVAFGFGYDPKDDANNTEEIVAHKVVLDALVSELDKLTEEKIRLCRMVANKEPQRAVAEELDMARRTLRDKKDKVLSELAENMKYYK